MSEQKTKWLEVVGVVVLSTLFLSGAGLMAYGIWLAVADGPWQWVAAGFVVWAVAIGTANLMSELV